MDIFAYTTTSLGLPRRRSDAPYIDDRCYRSCNAAFLKGQASRDSEDFCATGSAFSDYYHYCLCCVGQDLRATQSEESAAAYLAADFAGILSQCGADDPFPRVADPCRAPGHDDVPGRVQTPFPTATVQAVRPSADSLSVGVSITVPLQQLRPGHTDTAATTSSDIPRYTPVPLVTTAWVTTTDADNHQVATVQSTFLTTTMSLLPGLDEQPPPSSSSPNDNNTAPASPPAGGGLTVGQVAAISVICTVVLLLLCTGLLFRLHRRRTRRREDQARRSAVEQWERHHNLAPQTSLAATSQGGSEEFEKAQLHSECMPTRELSGRAVPKPPSPPPVELPANEVAKDEDESNKEET
ncbi:hypothetical protein PG994_001256 [Apiospora phragmitis]|uniref:Uncharacterized protein n=1 Tax=Apiospora phragmitis TaxID=2905665 RepID=A0ABR1WT27_9PEZI